MSDLSITLPANFGYKGLRATKERGCFLLKTEHVKIQKTSHTPKEIRARHSLLTALTKAGFTYTDGVTDAKEICINLGHDIFMLSRHIPGRELDLSNSENLLMATERIALFHKAARGLDIEAAPATSLINTFAKETTALTTIFKQIKRRSSLSDFDMLMLKHADSYVQRANRAAAALSDTNYAVLHAHAIAHNHICHNSLKEENLPIYNDECYMLRFFEATGDLQLTDLCAFLRRYAEKSNRETPLAKLIETYNKILPLPPSAAEIITAQLSFPWAFIKTATQFYSKKRNFTPISITTRMTDILERQEAYDNYISDF